jgi:hypothetical protein
MILAPLHPSGCPSATAPPLVFTFEASSFNNFVLTIPTTEKASLNSKKSMSAEDKLAFFNAFGKAKDGAVVKY